MDDITKTKILKAIEAGQYGVSYTEPNCFVEHTKPSGEKYYIITGDDATFGCDYGSTTVTVCGYEFTWDYVESKWEGADEDLDEDDAIAEALNDRDDITCLSDCPDTDELIAFYELATGESVDAYYYDEYDVPVDEEDVSAPEDVAEETVTFEGKDYYLVEEPEEDTDSDGHTIYRATAIPEGAVADDTGCYDCVTVLMEADGDECGEPYAIEDSDATYDGVNQELQN